MKTRVISLTFVGLAMAALSGCIAYGDQNRIAREVRTGVGVVLTTPAGLTLYTYARDTQQASHCYDGCARNWPPFVASELAVDKDGFNVIERDDGSRQWAYQGQPLYTWVGDHYIGSTGGHQLGNLWYAAQP